MAAEPFEEGLVFPFQICLVPTGISVLDMPAQLHDDKIVITKPNSHCVVLYEVATQVVQDVFLLIYFVISPVK